MEKILNPNQDLQDIAEKMSVSYANASPFPSICFKDFFSADYLDQVLEEFPDLAQIKVTTHDDAKQKKFAGKGELYFGPYTRQFMRFLNSEPFLNFLQTLTGIDEPLIGDPHFVGGGQHEIVRGGFLKIHADFNKHKDYDLDRRVNALVYLNKSWKEEYGGHLEFWNKDMDRCVKQILPEFNTLAIFSTTDYSYHGHPDSLRCPESMTRKSLALYYYSNGRPGSEIIEGQEVHSTLFKQRQGSVEDARAFRNPVNTKDIAREITPPFLWKIGKKLFD